MKQLTLPQKIQHITIHSPFDLPPFITGILPLITRNQKTLQTTVFHRHSTGPNHSVELFNVLSRCSNLRSIHVGNEYKEHYINKIEMLAIDIDSLKYMVDHSPHLETLSVCVGTSQGIDPKLLQSLLTKSEWCLKYLNLNGDIVNLLRGLSTLPMQHSLLKLDIETVVEEHKECNPTILVPIVVQLLPMMNNLQTFVFRCHQSKSETPKYTTPILWIFPDSLTSILLHGPWSHSRIKKGIGLLSVDIDDWTTKLIDVLLDVPNVKVIKYQPKKPLDLMNTDIGFSLDKLSTLFPISHIKCQDLRICLTPYQLPLLIHLTNLTHLTLTSWYPSSTIIGHMMVLLSPTIRQLRLQGKISSRPELKTFDPDWLLQSLPSNIEMKHLTILTLWTCDTDLLNRLSLPKLEELTLHSYEMSMNDTKVVNLTHLLNTIPQLKILYLYETFANFHYSPETLVSFQHLIDFRFESHMLIHESTLISILKASQNLVELYMIIEQWTNEFTLQLYNNGLCDILSQQLTELTLTSLSPVTSINVFIDIIRPLQQLRYINLEFQAPSSEEESQWYCDHWCLVDKPFISPEEGDDDNVWKYTSQYTIYHYIKQKLPHLILVY